MAQPGIARVPEGRRRAEERRRAQSAQGKTHSPPKPANVASASSAARAPMAPANTNLSRPAGTPTVVVTSGGREAALARRRAASGQGKSGIGADKNGERTRAQVLRVRTSPSVQQQFPAAGAGCGCGGNTRRDEAAPSVASSPRPGPGASGATPASRLKNGAARRLANQPEGRQLALARRRMLAGRGKLGVEQTDRVRSPAQRARHLNPELSGRELAREVRSERSRNGRRGQKTSTPCGRQRPSAKAAEDAPWKVGVSETARGQTVTGTQVGRSKRVSGDESSTCRAVTGTEYLGADIFQEFCQTEVTPNPRKVAITKTAAGRTVTGTEVGRSTKVTGNEVGNCQRVTGNEYFPAEQVSAFCGTTPAVNPPKIALTKTAGGQAVSGSQVDRAARVTGTEAGADRQPTGTPYISAVAQAPGRTPPWQKVGATSTLRGGQVTGMVIGRSERVTGDEPGSCRHITGDEFISAEQYSDFCGTTVPPEAPKVERSSTVKGQAVTGTQAGRSTRVTGNEPGTCKVVTGTPYVGVETLQQNCTPAASRDVLMRGPARRATPGMPMTGAQPGMGGRTTGDRKGACEAVTGTPYVGSDQFADTCGALAAVPGNPDYPQSLDGTPWTTTFSVSSPARDAQRAQRQSSVTGTRYESGSITGPFVMGEGKITGTEQFRFGTTDAPRALPAASAEMAPQKSRVTGEGIDTGLKITGDDWGRNDRVTGTEGRSAVRRNPTRRGATVGAMPAARGAEQRAQRQSEPPPPSKVTGSSGNTDKGAFVTVSGGARG